MTADARGTAVEIVTERLLLREYVEGDLQALVAYQADPRYAEFWQEDPSVEQGRQLLHTFREWAAARPRRNYQLAIARLDTPLEVIGSCGLRGQGLDATTAEFGIELAPACWRQGYGTEAARAILHFGFGELGLREVLGVSVTENRPVSEMVSRLGFTRHGSRPGPAWMAERGWSETQWLLTRNEWEARQRLCDSPGPSENCLCADVRPDRLGVDQATPVHPDPVSRAGHRTS